jgi:hypothetical protein
MRDTIREQAIAETPARRSPRGLGSALPLSYRRMERRAGFEPATSRFTDDVTAIFTTDRETVGGERAMLLLPLRATAFRRAGLEPARRRSALPRSNKHLHHRLADIRRRTSTIAKGTLGNRRYRLSMASTQVLAFRKNRDPRRNGPREAASTVRDVKGGIRTRFSMARSIRNLHHQRSSSREMRQTKLKNEFRRGALNFAPP